MKNFICYGKVWIWPGVGGWHFVYVDRKFNKKIKELGKPYGGGFVKIKATLGKTSWETALFPYKKEDVYLLSIKAAVRKKESVLDGDEVKIKIEIL